MSWLLLSTHTPEAEIFDANSDHCLAYWLDSSNIDHYHIHMIETCACVALVLMILIYLQCKKWNMKKLYTAMPPSLPLEDTDSVTSNQQPLLHNNHTRYYQTADNFMKPSIEIHKASIETLNGDEWSLNDDNDEEKKDRSPSPNHLVEDDEDNEDNHSAIAIGTTVTASTVTTFPFYDDTDSESDSDDKPTWNIFAKLKLINYRRNKKKYKKKYGVYPQSLHKKAKKSGNDTILLPCFMKVIYLFFGGVTFKFILASLATNNMEMLNGNYNDNEIVITVLNSIVSFLDTVLWYSLSFLLIQKSSSKRAFLRAFIWGFMFAIILCAVYGYAYSMGEPIAWNISSILLLFYYITRVLICIVLIGFMYTKRHNHNRWKRWASLRFLIVFIFIINIAYVLAVIAMSLKNYNNNNNINNISRTDESTNTSALLDICWFTLVELVRNLIQPFILYGTLLKDTDYWRKLAKLITMSSAIEVPRRGGTLDLSIENYKDIEAFARTTRVPVLDFADFELRKPIGRGATASVYRAYYRGYPVACKDLAANLINEITYDSVHRFCREALLFIHIQHINIIKFFGVCLRPPALYLVFELATHGTLRNLLDSSARKRKRALRRSSITRRHQSVSSKNPPLSWQEKLWIALDIATGMQVLHHKDIIHRDLNTNNVLVTFMKEEGRLVAKICDFGLARKLRKSHQDRVHSSFLMTSPSIKNGFNGHIPNPSNNIMFGGNSLPNTLPLPLPSNIYRQQQQQQQQQQYHKKHNYNKWNAIPSHSSSNKKNNSLPPIFGSASITSMAGVDNNDGLTSSELNKELSHNSKHKKRRHRNNRGIKSKKKKNEEIEDESPSSHISSSNNISTSLPAPPPTAEMNRFDEIPELNPVEIDPFDINNNPLGIPNDNAPSLESLGGTLGIIDAGNSLDALTTECGTVAYMAPELLEHLNITKHFTYATENLVLYTKSIDVYSFGLILWELCTEQALYEDFDDLRDIKQYVLLGKRPHIPSYILGTYAGLMKDCWSQSPLHRPDFNEIVRRLHLMLGLSRNKSEDNSLFSWTLVDAMRESGRY